jgi:hypothetical protein
MNLSRERAWRKAEVISAGGSPGGGGSGYAKPKHKLGICGSAEQIRIWISLSYPAGSEFMRGPLYTRAIRE